MSPERANAYRRVTWTLRELGPSKLLDHEQDLIRRSADNLIFSSDLAEDLAAREALADVEQLCLALVESGRWEQVTAARLAEDLTGCGPPRSVELKAA
jgi:hypothetical protein